MNLYLLHILLGINILFWHFHEKWFLIVRTDLLLKVLQLNWLLRLAMIPPSVTQYCSFPESLFIFDWPSPAPSSRQRAEFNIMKSIQHTYRFTTRDQRYWLWLIFSKVTVYWLTFNQTGYKKKTSSWNRLACTVECSTDGSRRISFFFREPWINLSDRVKHAAQTNISKNLYDNHDSFPFRQSSSLPERLISTTNVSHHSDKFLLSITCSKNRISWEIQWQHNSPPTVTKLILLFNRLDQLFSCSTLVISEPEY